MQLATDWRGITIPLVDTDGWVRADAEIALREIERLRRALDAAHARVVAVIGASGKDAAAFIARNTGVSTKAAREQARVAKVVEQLEGAGEALASGRVSSEHLRSLAPVADDPETSSLLGIAATQTPEEFRKTVTRYQQVKNPKTFRDRQREARSVSFFSADNGCIGMRAILPPIEGEELQNRLSQIADAAWRAEHPERAETLGGHDGEPLHRRLADALMELIRGKGGGFGKPTIVVTVDAETLEANIVGVGPVPFGDVVAMVDRSDLYACIRSTTGGILKFGRNRRLASALQQLALVVRDGKCVYEGCDAHWNRTQAHHANDFEFGGSTNLDQLALLCKPHHSYLHQNKLRIASARQRWQVEPDPRFADSRQDTG